MNSLHATAALLLASLAFAPSLRSAEPPSSAAMKILGSTVFHWDKLEVKPSGVGDRRDVARIPTATFTEFECHVSTLNAGLPSHPPHVHPQEELIVLNEGTLEVFINGARHRIGPGSLFFFASYDSHAVRNVGEVPARYHVFNFSTAKTRAIPAEPAAETASADKLRSAVFPWESLPVQPTKVGARREVFDAPTVTTERFRCHVTTLNGGEISHPPHRHPEEEVILVKEGLVEVVINGETQRAGVGSVFFFASNDEHGLKNAGSDPASYYVIRVHSEATPATQTL